MRKDDVIKNEILDELDWDPAVRMTDVGVTVVDGAVTLTGTVQSYPERSAAERAAKRVRGVVAVAEDIKVALSPEYVQDDSQIAKRIAHVLEWDPAVPHEKIQAEVRNGAVTLTGEVKWYFLREEVEKHVARLSGVRSVDNRLTVAHHVTKPEVRKEIIRALHRNADLEASHVDVDVTDGKVRLDGTVKAFYERDLIKNAVWSAPGVTSVEDHLRIG
jgi:osmotically-inducible protein OsmY